ncbi:hypothetical protein [Amphritea sp. HPY]|uniref:hypothetical protein n=1 Tax=Amphritea sp. HPY TaxID=3421652 RepID=UPI003D7C43A2
MKILVVLPPVATQPEWHSQILSQPSDVMPNRTNPLNEVIEEGLKLKRKDAANEVTLAVMGQDGATHCIEPMLIRGFDRSIRIASDMAPGTMEIAEQLLELIQTDTPDLVLIGREDGSPESRQIGKMLAELLEFRCASCPPSSLYRLLVIREIGSGLHTVELPLMNAGPLHNDGLYGRNISVSRGGQAFEASA